MKNDLQPFELLTKGEGYIAFLVAPLLALAIVTLAYALV